MAENNQTKQGSVINNITDPRDKETIEAIIKKGMLDKKAANQSQDVGHVKPITPNQRGNSQ